MKAIGITDFEILRKGRMKAGAVILLKRSKIAPGKRQGGGRIGRKLRRKG
jgi:hypothetical protein